MFDNVGRMRALIGSQELAAGRLTRHELATSYRRILPDVYVPKRAELNLDARIEAAWLWSRGQGVISGVAASALHGALWVDDATPIELNQPHNKVPFGIIARRDTLLDAEITRLRRIAVTTVERTAFDLARRGPVGTAVARLDALARATQFTADEVLAVARVHPGVRGRRRVREVLDLVDAGAQSPKETWLRLLACAAGFVRPQTQYPILGPDGCPRYYLDMGWPKVMVALEYDGQQHRTDPVRYRHDVARSEYIAAQGWRRVAVLAGDRRAGIVDRLARAGAPRVNE